MVPCACIFLSVLIVCCLFFLSILLFVIIRSCTLILFLWIHLYCGNTRPARYEMFIFLRHHCSLCSNTLMLCCFVGSCDQSTILTMSPVCLVGYVIPFLSSLLLHCAVSLVCVLVYRSYHVYHFNSVPCFYLFYMTSHSLPRY